MRTNQRLRFFLSGLVLAFLLMNTGFVASAGLLPAGGTTTPTTLQGTPLRFMSWNSLFLNKDVESFNSALVKLQPDVIAIQEIGSVLVDELAANWQETYPYMELYPTGTPAGMGIVSRYPFRTTTRPDFDEQTGCNCQIVTIDLQGKTITLINAHPWPPEIEFTVPHHWSNLLALNTVNQDPIFDQLLARIHAVDGPLLVAGDLNTMPFQPNVQRLQAILVDTFVEAGSGLGYTFPADGKAYNLPSIPFMRIDYIFHSADWYATATHVDAIPGSDHRYVIADLVLP
ncbi:MAG: endonuclease/exonuclease/phosphatase family protein [Caldilineaceae bacterium]|nr:endonuclease/exonuclease/phosphatase family protein [Caldilineaceae bacterium]